MTYAYITLLLFNYVLNVLESTLDVLESTFLLLQTCMSTHHSSPLPARREHSNSSQLLPLTEYLVPTEIITGALVINITNTIHVCQHMENTVERKKS